MDINYALDVLQEIEDLLYSGSYWNSFWADVLEEVWAEDVDKCFLEAFAKLDDLCSVDQTLHQFINYTIKGEARKYYTQLLKTRQVTLLNSRVYAYLDVLYFVKKIQSLTQRLRQQIDQIYTRQIYTQSKLASVRFAAQAAIADDSLAITR
jgi:uncharacterized protein YerC